MNIFGSGNKEDTSDQDSSSIPTSNGHDDPQQPRPIRRPKIGLALGAGVARGWAHIGVIKCLEREGIKPDVIAGTSIGAVVSGALASNSLDSLEEWALSLKQHTFFRWLDFRLGGSGLFGSNKLNELMDEKFGNQTFEDLPIPFTAIACELKTGHEIWLNKGSLSDSIQASFALPGVFEPQRLNHKWLVDGALVNPVPVSVCRAQGCELIIAVNLSEDLYGRAKLQTATDKDADGYGVYSDISLAPNVANSKGSMSFFKKLFGHQTDAPSMFTNMVASLNILQNRLSRSRLAGDPPDVTVMPRCGHIGLMEFHRAEELIAEGEAAFEEALPHLRDALSAITVQLNS